MTQVQSLEQTIPWAGTYPVLLVRSTFRAAVGFALAVLYIGSTAISPVLAADDIVVVELVASLLSVFGADDHHVAFVGALRKSTGRRNGL